MPRCPGHAACRFPSFLVGQSIPLCVGSFLPSLSGHWSLSDLTLGDQDPPPRHRMSHPTIGIGHPVSDPPPPSPYPDPPARPRPPRAPRSHGAVFQDSHMPYGIRNSESQNRESGYREFSWCGIFPLDHEDHGAAGWVPYETPSSCGLRVQWPGARRVRGPRLGCVELRL